MVEEIKPISEIDFPGYFVSNHGKVYSDKLKGSKSGSKGPLREKVTTLRGSRRGDPGVTLMHKDGYKVSRKVSRLVALSFVPNPNNYPLVMHKDDNHLNNHYLNLEWGTQKQNIKQREDRGRSRWAKLKTQQ